MTCGIDKWWGGEEIRVQRREMKERRRTLTNGSGSAVKKEEKEGRKEVTEGDSSDVTSHRTKITLLSISSIKSPRQKTS
jgi:hypothetical protein